MKIYFYKNIIDFHYSFFNFFQLMWDRKIFVRLRNVNETRISKMKFMVKDIIMQSLAHK